MVHFAFSGKQNQSHQGACAAWTAGAQDEGGKTGSGAKSAAGENVEEENDSC